MVVFSLMEDTGVCFFTVTTQVFLSPFALTVIVTFPAFFAVNFPLLLILAILVLLDFHVAFEDAPDTLAVKVVLPFSYIDNLLLERESDGVFTLTLHVLVIPFAVTEMVVVPAFFPVILPVLLAVAMLLFFVFHTHLLLSPLTLAVKV